MPQDATTIATPTAGRMLDSQEHADLMEFFERQQRGRRLDRERDKALWARGHVYQSGEVNELFLAFRKGYALAKAMFSTAGEAR
jgi:hypothetical protein